MDSFKVTTILKQLRVQAGRHVLLESMSARLAALVLIVFVLAAMQDSSKRQHHLLVIHVRSVQKAQVL